MCPLVVIRKRTCNWFCERKSWEWAISDVQYKNLESKIHQQQLVYKRIAFAKVDGRQRPRLRWMETIKGGLAAKNIKHCKVLASDQTIWRRTVEMGKKYSLELFVRTRRRKVKILGSNTSVRPTYNHYSYPLNLFHNQKQGSPIKTAIKFKNSCHHNPKDRESNLHP